MELFLGILAIFGMFFTCGCLILIAHSFNT